MHGNAVFDVPLSAWPFILLGMIAVCCTWTFRTEQQLLCVPESRWPLPGLSASDYEEQNCLGACPVAETLASKCFPTGHCT